MKCKNGEKEQVFVLLGLSLQGVIRTVPTGCYENLPIVEPLRDRQFLLHITGARRVAEHSGTCVTHALRAVLS